MRRVTTLILFLLLLGAGTAFGQQAETEYMLEIAPSTEFTDPFTTGFQSGARDVSGPYDLDGDGLMEVLVTDYTGGGRVHVVENNGANTWQHVYSTPWIDSTNTSQNARVVVGADLDGDEMGEIVFISGAGMSDTNPNKALFGNGGITVYEYTGTDNDYGDQPASVYQVPLEGGTLGELDRFRTEVMEAVDVDSDGVQELLWSNNGSDNTYDNWFVLSVDGDIGGFHSWTQEARASSRDSETFDPVFRGGGSPYALHAADLDGDGTYELSMHSWNGLNFTNADVTGADTYVLPGADAENAFIRPGYDVLDVDDVSLMGGTVVDINGDGDDEVFYPRLNSYRSQAVTLINYEAGEDVLQLTYDQVFPDFLEDPTESLMGITNLGVGHGDLDGDGRLEVIGAGWEHTGEDVAAGEPPYFLHAAEWTGPMDGSGDPEDRSNYTIYRIATPLEGGDLSFFDVIERDSAGVMETYYENASGVYFPAKIAFLGDADNDGFMEMAAAFQGVDDSLTTFAEVWNEAVDTLAWHVGPDDADFIGTGNTERGMAYNPDTERVLVVSRTANPPLVPILDASTGEVVDTLNTEGVAGGTFPLNQIGVTADGEIFAANLTVDAAGSALKIYYWADEQAEPMVVYDEVLAAGGRYGDALGVGGSGANAMVYLSGSGSDKIAAFAWETPDTTLAAPTLIDVSAGAARGAIAPVDGGAALWINGFGTETQKIDALTGAVLTTIPGSVLPAATMALAAFETRGGEFIAVGPGTNGEFMVLDVEGTPRVVATIDAIDAEANPNKTGAVAYDSEMDNLVVLDTNNGVASFNLELGYYREETAKQAANRRFMRIFSLAGMALDADDVAGNTLPREIELSQNYPNPFRAGTRFHFTLPQDERATVTVYDVLGRTVKTLVDDQFYMGGVKNELAWDGTTVSGHPAAAGLYVYTVETESHRTSQTMVLVK